MFFLAKGKKKKNNLRTEILLDYVFYDDQKEKGNPTMSFL